MTAAANKQNARAGPPGSTICATAPASRPARMTMTSARLRIIAPAPGAYGAGPRGHARCSAGYPPPDARSCSLARQQVAEPGRADTGVRCVLEVRHGLEAGPVLL